MSSKLMNAFECMNVEEDDEYFIYDFCSIN